MIKRNIIFSVALLIITVLIGAGVSYSLWNISVSQDTVNMAETKCFDLSINNQKNSITLKNAYPINNDKGKELTPFTFTVTNICDITAQYSVNLEILNGSNLTSKFVDVMFDGNIKLLNSYDTTDKVSSNSVESRKLTTGILKSGESEDYSLRLWIDYDTTLEDLNNEIKTFKAKIVVAGKPINYDGNTVFNFDYTGAEQIFTVPISGTYKLETWGAQGNIGGYGGYSSGLVKLVSGDNLYIAVGGQGLSGSEYFAENVFRGIGGFNGGGSGSLGQYYQNNTYWSSGGGGGGATSIQNILIGDGQLKNYENNKNTILIVSGGGGGHGSNAGRSGDGGGISGNKSSSTNDQKNNQWGGNAIPGTQNSGYSFGLGQTAVDKSEVASFGAEGNGGGGGGYYGGFANMNNGASSNDSGAGGSGYIGNTLLTNKVMYCYNCEESNEESTKTISTTCNEETPTSYCAKKGDGYARITLVNIDD